MKKKRIKFGLAIAGALAAFLLALLELVLAPTLASAGKGIDAGHGQDGGGHAGYHNPAYFAPPTDNGSGNDGTHHSDNGVGPCAGASCETHDDGAPGGGPGHGHDDGHGNDQGNNQGDGHSPNHDPEGNSQGGSPWFAGGNSGGGGGGGSGPHGNSNSCSADKDKDAKSDDKACDDDSGNKDDGVQQFSSLTDKDSDPSDDSTDEPSDGPPNNLRNDDPPGDDDLPPVDPNCFPFAEKCDTHDGNPPNTVLTDEPNKVPEPLTLSLFAVGLTGVATLRRRSRQKAIAQPD